MRSRKKFFFMICLSLIWTGIPFNGLHAQTIGMKQAPSAPKQKSSVLSTGGGRYLFGQISDSSKDQFMLDTLTGRLWRICESGEVGPYLNPVPYRNKDGKYSNQPKESSEPEEKIRKR